MKSIIKIFVALALLTGVTSCENFLDQPLHGTADLNTYFQTEEECIRAVNGCYQSAVPGDWWQTMFFRLVCDMATDDMWAGNTTQDGEVYKELCHYRYKGKAGNSYNASNWEFNFKTIYRCNVTIKGIEESPVDNADLKARLIGEAKFIRALIYFELAKNYGGVPVLTKPMAPTELKSGRATLEQTYEQIISDLKDAAKVLPESYGSADKGRASWGAAKAFLAKAYLFTEKWSDAQTTAEEVINKHLYDLEPDFANVWSCNNANGMESIFEIQYNDNTQYGTGSRLSVVTGSRDDSGWSWGLPSANLEKAFLDENDQVRLRSTIVKHGDDVYGDPDAKDYVISPEKHKSARICRKYYIPQAQRSKPYDAVTGKINYIMMRYADLLLIHAEAAVNNNDNGAAFTSLKKVRDRVGLTTNTALTGTALRNAIYNERRLELACENHRLYDLRRWKNPEDPTKSMLSYIMGPNGLFVKWNTDEATADSFEWSNNGEAQDKGILFEEGVYNLFPIPQNEIELSGGLITQNPGL